MKKVLQQTLFRLKTFLLLAVMFIVGSSAWAENWQTIYSNALTSTDGLTIINNNADESTWQAAQGYVQYSYNGAWYAADDYMIFPAQSLTAGKTYRVSFEYATYVDWGPEHFAVKYGTNNTVDALTNTLIEKTEVNIATFTTKSQTFTVNSSGSTYIAIVALSGYNMGYLKIKNYKLEVDADSGSGTSPGGEGGSSTDPVVTPDGTEVTTLIDGMEYTLAAVSYGYNYERFWNVNAAGNDIELSAGSEGTRYTCEVHGNKVALKTPTGQYLRVKQPNTTTWMNDYSLTGLCDSYNSQYCDLTIEKYESGIAIKGYRGHHIAENRDEVGYFTVSYSNYGTSGWGFGASGNKRWEENNTTVFKARQYTPADVVSTVYTIDLVNAPDGAYVTLDEQRFEADGTYTVEKSFGKNDLTVYEPAGYYSEVEYTRDSHTYTVTYYAYNYYDVTVTGTTDPAAGVVYNEQTYGNGTRIETKEVLTQSSVEPVDVAGYNVELTFANGEFRVAYTEKPVQGVPWVVNVASIFTDCTVVDYNSDGKTWAKNGEEIYYHYHGSNYANDYIILPAVRLEAGKTYTVGVECHQDYSYTEKLEVLYGTTNNVAGMTNTAMPVKNVTWNNYAEVTNDFSVAADGVYYFAIHAVSNPDLLNLYVKTFSIKEPEPRQCVMDVASTYFSTGNVEQINSNLTFVADVNTEGEHSGAYGSSTEVPDGVTLKDGNGTSYTISTMLWWDKGTQVAINLPSAITAPGHYTLTIPEGVIPCVGNKANKEIVFEWTIAEPTTYTVTFAAGAPAGASVTIDGNTYTESTTFQSRNNLDENSANVGNVEGYEGSVAYDSENKEFTITYTALPTYDYYVVIYPTEDTDLKIRIDGKEYGDSGMDTYTFYKELAEGDIVLPEYPGYYANPSLDIDNNYYIITVEYTPLPSLAIGSSATDREGNYWTSFCLNEPVEFGAGVTPCIVTGTDNGVLTVEEIVAEDNEYSYDLDFTTGAYSGNSFTAMDGKLTVEGVNWIFNTVYGYAETANTEDWTTVTFTLADDFNGEIKSIRLLTANDTNSAWFSIDGGITWLNNVTDIPVHGKTITLGAWYDQAIKHFYLDIVESGDAPVFPANTAVLLKSDAPGAVTYYTRPAGNVDVSANILQASGETGFKVSNDADYLYYKLTLNAAGDEGSAGFYWDKNSYEGHSINVPAHKAYLRLPVPAGSNRAVYHFGGEDVLTGVESISTEADNAPVYNLQGQRVNATKAGVYVKNGKKFIVK